MRGQSLFWGIVITFVGIILLLNQIWSFNLSRFLMPSLLILIGLWFLITTNTYSREINEQHVSIPTDDMSEAEISLQHGAGILNVKTLDNPTDFLSGTFNGGVDQAVEKRGSILKVKLQTPPKILFPNLNLSEGLNWDMGINPNIPTKLDIKGGANEINLDLTDLIITEFRLETGASSTEIKMPSHAGYTRAQIHAGAASVNIRIPEGTAARISIKGSGISDIHVNKNRFHEAFDGFESPDYSHAANKIDISIEVGLGSITIR